MRAGLATGGVVMGSIGSARARNYTVVGDTVNLAARLEAANKSLGTRILVAEATCEAASDLFAFRAVDIARVRGRARPEPVFELMAPRSDLEPATARLIESFGSVSRPIVVAIGTAPADPSCPASLLFPTTVPVASCSTASSCWSVTRRPRAGTAAGRSGVARPSLWPKHSGGQSD